MSEELTDQLEQPEVDSAEGTTTEGLDTGAGEQSTDTFSDIDPTTLSPEHADTYKEMQSAFTKKMQGLSEREKELEPLMSLRDQYNADPRGTIINLARQQGLTIAEAQAAVADATAQTGDWEPQTWAEAEERFVGAAVQKVMSQLEGSVIPAVKKMQASSIEKSLDDIDPMWRKYEDNMRQTMQKHPTLASDIPTLYEMSIPTAERESRATKAALAKMRNLDKSGKVSGASTTKSTPAAGKVTNFDEAVAEAKRRLAARG